MKYKRLDQPDEQFYRVNKAQYLYIQCSDDGYDYTFYDAASKKAMDGGQLDNPNFSISEAAKAVCELYEAPMDDMAAVANELPEEFVEPAPRDYRAELADHFSKEDERPWDTDTKLDEYPMPDKNCAFADLEEQGIYDERFLPISKETAAEMFDCGLSVYAVIYGSMSVSNIVAVKKDGAISCHYVDRFGFTELHGFLFPSQEAMT